MTLQAVPDRPCRFVPGRCWKTKQVQKRMRWPKPWLTRQPRVLRATMAQQVITDVVVKSALGVIEDLDQGCLGCADAEPESTAKASKPYTSSAEACQRTVFVGALGIDAVRQPQSSVGSRKRFGN